MTDPGTPTPATPATPAGPGAPAAPAAPEAPGTPAPPTGWTLWSVLSRVDAPLGGGKPLAAAIDEGPDGVVLRGIYDLTGMRADADLMLWLHGDTAEGLQAELRRLRRTAELTGLVPSWSAMGVHRPAEFAADHQPAFMMGKDPLGWLCLYPFVRSYEWYLLPTDERRTMLAEHGLKGRAFPRVLANTVSAFGLGDYEWLLAFEADELTDVVDLMRHLRATEARRHVRDELPFFTGRRIEVDEVAEVLL